jgi:hypothetical protein
MAFTYTEDLTVDRDFVRFHTHDTIETESQLSDAIIASLITNEGSKQNAVIAGLRYKMQSLLVPDVQADEIEIDQNKAAADGYRQLIRDKQIEFGLGAGYTSTVTYTYRADSSATEEPYTS